MKPLEGLTVVSIEQAVAAPYATRQLADLGARVIKIERPGSGDFCRDYDETVHGLSSHFVWLNRSKESVVLDLKSPDGLAAAKALVQQADVFVQNLAPGVAERLGLGAEETRTANPRLIHCSISGYGKGGPSSSKKAYDLIIQCETGMLSITGTPDTPSKVGVSIADIAAGMYTFTGIQTALIQRGITGEGATLELSMLEALGEWMGYPTYYAEYGGTPPPRAGASHASIAPYGPYVAGDGQQVFFGVQNDREWPNLCLTVLRRPEMIEDERFSTGPKRFTNRESMDVLIAEALSDCTAEELVARLDEAGIANALLRDMHGFAAHPQLKARGRWRDVITAGGTARSLIPPATLEGNDPVMGPVPSLGEHTETVLAELHMNGVAPRPPNKRDAEDGAGLADDRCLKGDGKENRA